MPAARRAGRGGALASVLLAAGWLATAGAARAHIPVGHTSLHLLTATSELVVRARIADPDALLVLEEHGLRETAVVAEPLEVWKGPPLEGPLRFLQHGHGVARYAEGEEVLLFLRPTARVREYAGSPLAAHVDWVSLQEVDAKYPLGPDNRSAFAAAVRGYARLAERPDEETRRDALRRLTVELLASPHPALARSALSDVVRAADAPLLTRADLPVLEPVLDDAATPIGIRIGLLAELERRGLVEGAPRWAKLLRTTRGRERFAAIRAAAAHPSPPVHAALRELLADEDAQLVAAAAVSLGVPGHDAAVAPLAALLGHERERVRMAAIRGLGRIATPEARRALAEAAASHPEPLTRRRAAAEVEILARRAAPSHRDPGHATGATDPD